MPAKHSPGSLRGTAVVNPIFTESKDQGGLVVFLRFPLNTAPGEPPLGV